MRMPKAAVNFAVLSRHPVERTSFAAWSMKYVPFDAPMKSLLREQGLDAFDPYRFNDATVARALELLRAGGDVTLDPRLANPSPRDATAVQALLHARWALVASLFAVVLAGVAAFAGPG